MPSHTQASSSPPPAPAPTSAPAPAGPRCEADGVDWGIEAMAWCDVLDQRADLLRSDLGELQGRVAKLEGAVAVSEAPLRGYPMVGDLQRQRFDIRNLLDRLNTEISVTKAVVSRLGAQDEISDCLGGVSVHDGFLSVDAEGAGYTSPLGTTVRAGSDAGEAPFGETAFDSAIGGGSGIVAPTAEVSEGLVADGA